MQNTLIPNITLSIDEIGAARPLVGCCYLLLQSTATFSACATSEIIWVKVTMKGCKNLYITGCYRAKATVLFWMISDSQYLFVSYHY